MPEESGPRSVIPTSIGTINSPKRGRNASFFTSNPTIPHMSEHLQIAAGFPVAHVAGVLYPLHALELNELLRELGAEALLHHLVRVERIDGLFQGLRQQLDAAVADLCFA